MITNGYLRKRIISQDGEVEGFNQQKIPLCLIINSNARYQSINISDGLKNKQFTAVYTLRTNLENNNASKIEIGDQIENLITNEKRIVSYIEVANKKYGSKNLIYYVGVE